MPAQLNAVEARVLGCLVEKSLTTPELYPLTLNALVNACNQKSSREPVMSFDFNAVQACVNSLIEKGFTGPAETAPAQDRLAELEKRVAALEEAVARLSESAAERR